MTTDLKSPPPNQLATAIARAQGEARGVEKTGTNTFHRYRYATSESIIAEAKVLLAGNGLSVLPLATTIEGEAQLYLRQVWMLMHTSGESLHLEQSWPIVPEKGRPLDKAVASARTASLGYLLRDVLQLPRVEEGTDLDDNSRDRQEPRRDRRPPASKPAEERAPTSQEGAAVQKRSATEAVLGYAKDLDDATDAASLERIRARYAKTVKALPEQHRAAVEAYEAFVAAAVGGETFRPTPAQRKAINGIRERRGELPLEE